MRLFLLKFLAPVIIIIFLFVLLMWQTQNTPSTSVPNTQTAGELSTTSFEKTAIAIFTQNPILALSSTPAFAELIYNEVVRNLTEIPFPERAYYITPIPIANGVETPYPQIITIPECVTIISTLVDSSGSAFLNEIASSELEFSVDFVIISYGVETCEMPFEAAYSTIQVSIDTRQNSNMNQNMAVKQVLEIIVNHRSELENISSNPSIEIDWVSENGTTTLHTTYDAAFVAVR